MTKRPLVPILSMLILSVAACHSSSNQGKDVSDNVITGNDGHIFYKKQLGLSLSKSDEVVQTVKTFAQERGMHFLLARNSLPPGDLNVSANGPDLNIKVMHTAAVGDTGFQVFAISRGEPNPADQEAVKTLVCRLQADCDARSP